MHYICLVKMFRRFCLVMCALGVFLNVSLGNLFFGAVLHASTSPVKSKQIAFSKASDDLNINSFEFEEDFELDEDGVDFDHSISFFILSKSLEVRSFSKLSVQKRTFFNHHYRWDKLPLFIQFQNFRI